MEKNSSPFAVFTAFLSLVAFSAFGVNIQTSSIPATGKEMVWYTTTLSTGGTGTAPYTWSAGSHGVEKSSSSSWSTYGSVGTPLLSDGDDYDDRAWPLALPFEFPFYGEGYTNIWISSNGNIYFGNDLSASPLTGSYFSFDGTTREYSYSTAQAISGDKCFLANRMLCVCWCDAKRRGSESDNIYVDADGERVVVRYDLWHNSSDVAIKAVAVLNRNGEITVAYGDSACLGAEITTGISAGNGADFVHTEHAAGALCGSPDLVYNTGSAIPGLDIDASGVYSGYPTAAGTYEPVFTVVDALGSMCVRKLNQVTVAQSDFPRPVITAFSPEAECWATVNGSLQFQVTASGATRYHWFVDGVDKGETVSPSYIYMSDGSDRGKHTVQVYANNDVWADAVSVSWKMAVGNVWYVSCETGNDSNSGDYSHRFKTIRKAVGFADDGDTIYVADGVYRSPLTVYPSVYLESEGGPEGCIIDAGYADRCVMVTVGENVPQARFNGFTFRNGKSDGDGGCVYGGSYYNCIFTGSRSNYGAVHDAELVRCRVFGNYGTSVGGVCDSVIRDCTVYGNIGEYEAGGVGRGNGDTVVENSIVCGNTCYDQPQRNDIGGNVDVDGLSFCSGDPKLFHPEGGDFRLREGSPCLKEPYTDNIGWYKDGPASGYGVSVSVEGSCDHVEINYDPVNYKAFPAGSNVRLEVFPDELHVIDGWYDENGTRLTDSLTMSINGLSANRSLTLRFRPADIYVDASTGSDANSGRFSDEAKKTIQAAIDAAEDGDTVKVAEGTYYENLTTVRASGALRITIMATGRRDYTVVDGGGTTHCLLAADKSEVTTNTVVRGLTLSNGYLDAESDSSIRKGAGACGGWLIGCKVENCEVQNTDGGGVAYCRADRCLITGNRITNTWLGGFFGAGAYYSRLYDCLICGNTIEDTCISKCEAAGAGYCSYISGCTVVGNSNNSSDADVGGVSAHESTVCNTIVYGNTCNGVPAELDVSGSIEIVSCCTDDPHFVNAPLGDYTLGADSCARDAADGRYRVSAYDMGGNARLQGRAMDIGCYEATPVVDMGTQTFDLTGGADASVQIAAVGGVGDLAFTYDDSDRYGFVETSAPYTAAGTRDDALSSESGYYDLPFEFEYDGEKFNSVYVNKHGGLSFTVGNGSDERFDGNGRRWAETLERGYRAVIPFNYFVDYRGDAEGVFVDTNETRAVFRWVNGEYDVSCTLAADGTIAIAYGRYPEDFLARSYYNQCGLVFSDCTGLYLNPYLPADPAVAPVFTFRRVSRPDAGELTLGADGRITGRPMHNGRYFFKTTVTDEAGNCLSRYIAVNVNTSYVISFYRNNENATGSVPADKLVDYAEAYTIPNTVPALANSEFLGWAVTSGGAAVYQPGDRIVMATDRANAVFELYAVWKLAVMTDALAPAVGGTAYAFQPEIVGGGRPLDCSLSLVASNYNVMVRKENSFAVVGEAQTWSGDSFSETVDLPFAFNFYGEEYSKVTISADGYMYFGDSCLFNYSRTSEDEFKCSKVISVYTCDHKVEPYNGLPVRIESTGSSFTVCWTTRPYAGEHSRINASCTLGIDGSITLKYGSGNDKDEDVIIGISAGDGEHYAYGPYAKGERAGIMDMVFEYPAPLGFSVNATTGEITSDYPPLSGDFDVWYTVRSADGQSVSSRYVLSVTTSYQVRFNAAGGEGTMVNQDLAWNVPAALTANAFTREGHTFLGWTTSVGDGVVFEDCGTVTNLTAQQGYVVDLYAVWSVKVNPEPLPAFRAGEEYTGALTAAGGSGTYTWSTTNSLPSGIGLRSDGTFSGSPEHGGVFDICFVATDAFGNRAEQWFSITSKIDYTVHFVENGGTGTMADEAFVWGDAPKPLTANAFTRGEGDEYWDFLGWAWASVGEVAYTNCEKVADLADWQNSRVYLYAVWHPGFYELRFDLTGADGNTEPFTNRIWEVGSSNTFPSERPHRYGWILDGWADEPGQTARNYPCGSSRYLVQKRDTVKTVYPVWYETNEFVDDVIDGNACRLCFRGDTLTIQQFVITNGAAEVTIPASFRGRDVTAVGGSLMRYDTNVVTLAFADGLTTLGSEEGQFQSMYGLERTVFPLSFRTISAYAFCNSERLRDVCLNEGLTDIGYDAFGGCTSLACVEIPSTVQNIGGSAFYNVRRTVFKGTAPNAGESAFYNCRYALFHDAPPDWLAGDVFRIKEDGYIRNIQYLHANAAAWEGVTVPYCRVSEAIVETGTDGNRWYGRDDGDTAALTGPESVAAGDVTLPATVGGKPVTVITGAFLAGDTRVTSIVIPASVTNVEDCAFYMARNLRTVFVTSDGLNVNNSPDVYKGSPIEHVYYLPQHAGKWAGKTLFGVAMEPWPESDLWTAKFDGNGATAGEMGDVGYVSGYEYALPKNIFRNQGKKFVKWISDETVPAEYADQAVPAKQEPGAVVTFSAQWENAPMYTVAFDMNGGREGSKPDPLDIEVGTGSGDLPALEGTDRDGCWDFLGWAANPSATAADYPGGYEGYSAEADAGETVTLYAVWSPTYGPLGWVEDAENGNKYRMRLYGSEAIINDYAVIDSANPTRIVLPSHYQGFPVGQLTKYMRGQSGITDLVIPLTITSYDWSEPFRDYTSLTNIVFKGSGATHIVYGMFSCCTALEHVEIPEGIEQLDQNAFYGCTSLRSVKLPSTLRTVSAYAFYNCPIERLELPAGVDINTYDCLCGTKGVRCLGDQIPASHFAYACGYSGSRLQSLEYPATNATWNSFTVKDYSYFAGVKIRAFVGPVTVGGVDNCYFWVTEGDEVSFAYCEDELPATFALPEEVVWGDVTWSVADVEDDAFADQPTTTLRYPATWTEDMYDVDPGDYPAGITTMVPDGDYSVVNFHQGDKAGVSGGMAPFLVPDGAAVQLPPNRFSLPKYSFRGWTNWTDNAFYADKAVYHGAGTASVTLRAVWEFVGEYKLHYETGAQYVDAPADVHIPVGDTIRLATDELVRTGWIFGGWTNSVGTLWAAGADFTSDTPADGTFTLYAKWTKTSGSSSWTDGNGTKWDYGYSGDNLYIQSVVPGPGVTELTQDPLDLVINGTKVKSVDAGAIPEYSNGNWWSYDSDVAGGVKIKLCGGVRNTDVVVPSTFGGNTVRALSGTWFYDSAVTSIDIPGTVVTVTGGLCQYCSALTNVVLHSGTENIDSFAFDNTPRLRNVVLPDTLKNINSSAFSYNGLTEPLDMPTPVAYVSPEAFSYGFSDMPFDGNGCKYADRQGRILYRADTDVDSVPEGVQVICGQAFKDNTSETVILPSTVTSLGNSVFHNCLSIRHVTFKSDADLDYSSYFYNNTAPYTIAKITLQGGAQNVTGTWPNSITTLEFMLTPPAWNLKACFPGLTTVYYPVRETGAWEDYIAAHPELEFIGEGVDAIAEVGSVFEADVEELIGEEINDLKATVKVTGLPKGLALVKTAHKTGTVVDHNYYTIEGVPAETRDAMQNLVYIQVTTNKVMTTYPILLDCNPEPVTRIDPAATNGLDTVVYDLSAYGIDAGWTVKGQPAGMKYTAKYLAATAREAEHAAFTIYGKPTKAGDFIVTAEKANVLTPSGLSGKKYKASRQFLIRVETGDRLPDLRGQAYVPVEPWAVTNYTGGTAVTAVAGLPAGLKFTAKDVAATAKDVAHAAYTVYGIPTKAGTYAVTMTLADKTKKSFLMVIAEPAAPELTFNTSGQLFNTVQQGAMNGAKVLAFTADPLAKVTVAGLPTGMKLVAETVTEGTKKVNTGNYTIEGTPSKTGDFIVTVKAVLNGVTVTQSLVYTVKDNPYTGKYRGLLAFNEDSAESITLEVDVAAAGAVKITLVEDTVKTSVSAKNLETDGITAVAVLKGSATKGIPDRMLKIDFTRFSEECRIDGNRICYVCPVITPGYDFGEVRTFVVEETDGGTTTNSFGYFTSTYDSKKETFTVAGKMWDGTAIKASALPLIDGADAFVAPFLVTTKTKDVYYIVYKPDGSYIQVRRFGERVSVGSNGKKPTESDGYTKAELKLLKNLVTALPDATNVVFRLFGEGTLNVPVDATVQKAAVNATTGLLTVKYTVKTPRGEEPLPFDGYAFTAEMLPVKSGAATVGFRGFVTGTKSKSPTLYGIAEINND